MYTIAHFSYNSEIHPGERITIGYSALGYKNAVDNIGVSYTEKKKAAELMAENMYEYDGYMVKYQIADSWENASNIQVSITNTSDEIIHNWGLKCISEDAFSGIYNAEETREGNIHIIKNVNYNQDITSGSTVSFGYTQEYDLEPNIPPAFELTCAEEVVDNKDYRLELIVSNSWDNQKQAELIITNLGTRTIEDWTVKLDCNFTVDEIWNGELKSSTDNIITIINADYVQNINPNESIIVGMIISCNDEPQISSASMNNINACAKENVEELQIVNLNVNQKIIPVGENISNIIGVQLKGNVEADVQVYMHKEETWIPLGLLLDDGEINNSGDEIANDGSYVNKAEMLAEKEGEILCKVEVSKDGYVYDTEEFKINAVHKIIDEEYAIYYNNIDMISETIRQYLSGTEFAYNDLSGVISIVENNYVNNGVVSSVEIISGNVIKINFPSGLFFYFQITDPNCDNMIRGGGNNSEQSDVMMNKGSLSDYSIPLATVKSNKILLWAPYDTAWGESDETTVTQNIINESVYKNSFTLLTDEEADIDSLKTLNDYGMIIIATHGIAGEWIVTGECVTTNNAHALELACGEVCVYVEYTSTQTLVKKYMVNDQWIRNHIPKEMPDSIIINNSCESSKTTNLWSAFEGAGAKTYFGYNGAVTNKYINMIYQTLLQKLLLDGYSTEGAFDMTLDAHYGGGSMEIYGQGNLIMPYGMNNGTFENGLEGWMHEGDCRELTKIGSIMPTEGDCMVSISTGVGNNMQGGAIYQDMCIPDDATKLYVDWNYISAEFLNFIGSIHDDPFYLTLTICSLDKEIEIGRYSVNSLAEEYGATKTAAGKLICVSPEIILNGYTDIWMTNWICSEYDISDFAGENVTLKFSVQNAGDTGFPTMVLIDNVRFDVSTGTTDEYIPISSSVSADVVRTLTINDQGRSYVIYTKEFEIPDGQASGSRYRIMYDNGYADIEQVIMKEVKTEQEFVDAWSSMQPGEGEEKIDKVNIIMHGSYYTLTIDSDNDEYLTVSPDGVTAYDSNSTRICDLPKKSIRSISIYSCNTGLLDAINTDFDKGFAEMEGFFNVEGNVAQAFLNFQDVESVSAWDGSVTPGGDGSARSSHKQETFYPMWEELQSVRIVEPLRNNYSKSSLWRQFVSFDPDEIDNDPVGQVIYYNSEEGQYCLYTYHNKYWYGMELSYAMIDMDTNTVSEISETDFIDRLDGVVGDENDEY